MQQVLESMQKFTFKLFASLRDTIDKDQNVIFSPASIFAALAMTYCGARNATADEIREVMEIPNDDDFHQVFSKVWNGILKTHSSTKCDLNLANRLWLQNGFSVKKEFFDLLATYYQADTGNVDFVSDPKVSVETINKWVAEKTQGLIKDVVDEGSISPVTRLILSNTIYFKGKWKNPFSWCETKDMPFHASKDISYNVPMMYQSGRFGFNEDKDNDCKVLMAQYEASSLRMLIILPNLTEGLADLERKFETEFENLLLNWMMLRDQEVRVYLPKFQFSQKFDAVGSLRRMGITSLFDTASDLSGISDESLCVSNIVHQAFIMVDEEGTEACAYTGSIIRSASVSRKPNKFLADHPFMFLIVDNDTNLPVFLGRYCKPILA